MSTYSTRCTRRWLTASILAVALVGLAPSSPLAQDTDSAERDSLQESIRAQVAERNRASERGLTAPRIPETAIDNRWALFRDAQPDSPQESQAFEALLDTIRQLGVRNLHAHALILLQDASAAHRGGAVSRARQLHEWATELAPDSAQPYFEEARWKWDESRLALPAVVQRLQSAYAQMRQSIHGQLAIESLIRDLFLFVFILVAAITILLLALRYLALFAHDLRIRTGGVMSENQAQIAAFLIAVSPGLLWWSPAIGLVTLVAILAFYLDIWERVVVALLLAAFAMAPTLVAERMKLLASYAHSGALASQAITSSCTGRCRTRLDEQVAAGDPYSRLAVAWLEYRTGDPTSVARAAELVADVDSLPPSARPSAHLLRGNIAFVRGDDAEARAAFQRVTQADAGRQVLAAAYLNLYQVLRRTADSSSAQVALANAYHLAQEMVGHYARYEGTSQNQLLAIAPPDPERLGAELLSSTDQGVVAAATQERLAPWFGPLDPGLTQPLALGGLVLLVIGGLLRRTGQVSSHCESCGAPTERKTMPQAWSQDLCSDCYSLSSHGATMDVDARREIERRIDRWQISRPQALAAANALIPGGGFLLQGRAWIGWPLLLLAGTGVALLLVDATPLAVPYSLGLDRLFDGREIVAFIALGLAWGVSFVGSIFQLRD